MMLSSLPLFNPPPSHIIATSHTTTHTPNPNANPTGNNSIDRPHHGRREPKHPPSNKPAALSLVALAQSENLIEHRKHAIATFGYSWIKPAGCPKTMLGRREEQLEREEVERQIREAEEAELRGDNGFEDAGATEGEMEEGDEGMEQRDLDDDVPDADAQQTANDAGNETAFTAEDAYEREDTGFITGDAGGDGTEMGMLGEEELMMGGDLDEDVRSAEQSRLDFEDDDDDDAEGDEWQHTDTEEEIDDESYVNDARGITQPTRQSTGVGEDSEMMDMDITHASIDQGFPLSVSSFHGNPASTSGNAFITPVAAPTPPNAPAVPSSSAPRSVSAGNRRSWFGSSNRSPSGPAPGTITTDMNMGAPTRPRRNLWARAGSGLFSSTAAAGPESGAGQAPTASQSMQTPPQSMIPGPITPEGSMAAPAQRRGTRRQVDAPNTPENRDEH